ncbi:chromosome-associated kinesin KIF4B [Xylariomycetidae sp. FL0641]|nr:chromosome-associated kinesin KIF4B [Xylariomycetidae sp. FL0641]
MAASPPGSPGNATPRPVSAMVKPSPRSTSRLSMASKAGGGSRASDEDSGRTAVKVAVRVRPPLKSTDPGFDLIPQRFQRSMVQTPSSTTISIDAPQGQKLFVFDRVFSPDVDQSGIWDYLHESVNAFLQGYNVSLLAYGQSGAGKSYTMGTSGPGEELDLEAMGVVPRAATTLFEKLDGTSTKKSNRASMSQLKAPARYSMQPPAPSGEKTWQLKATYVEIYNEQLRDLLVPEHTPAHERSNVTIREDQKGNILLTGLRQMDINSVDDLLNALNFGSSIRQTDSTAVNAKSSRSHAVFSLNLVQRKSKSQAAQGADKRMSVPVEAMTGGETWVTTDSKLHFVDLAGSERLKNTGAKGDRAKEGISINAGLAALGKDSLGGNAITYMIACVTPAEFHLSETLNTVQYAQRARAIQSKPRIQQTEEGDKNAIIERLKAEVAFLREQVRNVERGGGERRNPAANERSERQAELQDQLLYAQENYTALSQRHAKLIAEMAKARDNEAAENQALDDMSPEDSATERLNRSNSFAKAVEQVVLEYEKTIQSLEQSLSNTRANLSKTETNLLEKETKCAYVETLNTQLQTRLSKLMDREANTESYLHDLETKLDGHTSGEEKNAAIISELRREISRVRENEAGCEDYISTLEERLAEAHQDQEIMQREMDRLEQVIERQRSLGKLDNLLYELDNIREGGPSAQGAGAESEPENGIGHRRTFSERSNKSHVSRPSQGPREVLPQVAEGLEEEAKDEELPQQSDGPRDVHDQVKKQTNAVDTSAKEKEYDDIPPQSPAQNQFVNDKLENVTQELVDLRVEHENTLTEYETLHSKYDEAMRTLRELQDQVDEARHPVRNRDSLLSATSPTDVRPSSFLSDGQPGDTKDGIRYSSRSLSSELSSAMESPATTADTYYSDSTGAPKASVSTETLTAESTQATEALTAELEKLKSLATEKELAEKQLAEKYAQLEDQHQETLDIVEELKTEVAKAKYAEPPSPRTATPVIRRKSSQNVMIIDRAHRSFAALRNIAADQFEGRPDTMQNFEVNLNAAMHELHSRSERIQELEADVANTRKEMESKMQIISGLTRERSSLKSSSPMDISMVAAMREQLEKNEQQLKLMQESHVTREKELVAELEALRASVSEAAEARTMSTADSQAAKDQEDELRAAHESKISHLEAELSEWEGKHHSALEAMQATEKQMKDTITELESELAAANAKFHEARDKESQYGDAAKEAESQHHDLVTTLRTEIDGYKAVIDSNAAKVAELEQAHASAKSQLDAASQARDLMSTESASHKELVGRLETQITEHEKMLKSHEEKLIELRSQHEQEIDDIKASSKQEYDSQLSALESEHAKKVEILEADLSGARQELMNVASQVAFALGVDVSVEKLSERIEDLVSAQKDLVSEQHRTSELESHVEELSTINNTIMQDLETVRSTLNEVLRIDGESPYPSVTDQLSAVKKKMHELENKNKKHSRLVEELEDQLQTNYDQAQITTNRLSTLQSERNAQLEDAVTAKSKAESELEALRQEMAVLQRTASNNSQIRKTASVTSLPSPPPAIPLPPLPSGGTTSPPPGAVPPTPSSGRPVSNDVALAQMREDQEARIRSIERHLTAERQLTSTLEEALTDLERQSNKVKADCEGWKKRAQELDAEIKELKAKPQQDARWRDSLHQIEEERKKLQESERVRLQLQERMNAINQKKKKKGSLNCF